MCVGYQESKSWRVIILGRGMIVFVVVFWKLNLILWFPFFSPKLTHPLTRPVSWINWVLHDDSHKVSLQLQILTTAVSQNMVALSICLQGSCISSRDWGLERKWNQLAVGLEPIVQSWHLEKNKERKRNIWMQKHCKYFLKGFCLCFLFFLTVIFLQLKTLSSKMGYLFLADKVVWLLIYQISNIFVIAASIFAINSTEWNRITLWTPKHSLFYLHINSFVSCLKAWTWIKWVHFKYNLGQ